MEAHFPFLHAKGHFFALFCTVNFHPPPPPNVRSLKGKSLRSFRNSHPYTHSPVLTTAFITFNPCPSKPLKIYISNEFITGKAALLHMKGNKEQRPKPQEK